MSSTSQRSQPSPGRSLEKADVEVRHTKIGRGVFATRRFSKGTVIGEVSGRIIDDDDYASSYCMDLGGSYSLEPRAPFRYLNHRCLPNAELFQWEDDHGNYELKLYVQAIRVIRPGDEITIDYAWPAHFAIPCLCTSRRCRGWIVDPAELYLVTGDPHDEPAV